MKKSKKPKRLPAKELARRKHISDGLKKHYAKELLRRKKISRGLKRHYKNKARYEVIHKRKLAADKAKVTRWNTKVKGHGNLCVVIWDSKEYAFFDKRDHPDARRIQDKLNAFKPGLYIVKLLLWLGIRNQGKLTVLSGDGIHGDLTERVFETHLTFKPYWENYYAALRVYMADMGVEKGTMQYDEVDFQLRQLQVC